MIVSPIKGQTLTFIMGILLSLILLVDLAFAKYIGRDLWRTFSSNETLSGEVIFSGRYSKNGILYVATSGGVISFDGIKWCKAYKKDTQQPINDLLEDSDGTWIAAQASSLQVYKSSLKVQVGCDSLKYYSTLKNFGAEKISQLIKIHDSIYIVTNRSLYIYEEKKINLVIKGSKIGIVSRWRNGLFITVDSKAYFTNSNAIQPIILPTVWDTLAPLSITNTKDDIRILTTKSSGLFYLNINNRKLNLTPVWDKLPIILQESSVTASTSNGDHGIVLGTDKGEILYYNQKGSLEKILNKKVGLKSSTIKLIISRSDGNTFVFFDTRVLWLDMQANKKIWDHKNGLWSQVKTIIADSGYIYIGTTDGIFKSSEDNTVSQIKSYGSKQIEIIEKFTKSSIFGHTSLLIGREDGVFDMYDNNIIQILDQRPTSIFVSAIEPSKIAIASNKNITIAKFLNAGWKKIGTLSDPFQTTISDFSETKDGDLIAISANGIVKTFAAKDWLSDVNLPKVIPINTQEILPNEFIQSNPVLISIYNKNYLLWNGLIYFYNLKSMEFKVDKNLSENIFQKNHSQKFKKILVSEDKKYIWLQTEKSVLKINPLNKIVTRINSLDLEGISGNAITLDSKNQQFLYATNNGITAIPSTDKENSNFEKKLPKLNIRSIKVDQKNIYDGAEKVFMWPQSYIKQILIRVATLDWQVYCQDRDYQLKVKVQMEPEIYLPLNSKCETVLPNSIARITPTQVTMQMVYKKEPTTSKNKIEIQPILPWFYNAKIFLILGGVMIMSIIFKHYTIFLNIDKGIQKFLVTLSTLIIAWSVALETSLLQFPSSLGSLLAG